MNIRLRLQANTNKLKHILKYLFQVLLLSLTISNVQAQFSLQGLPLVRTYSTEEYKGGIQNWDITQGASDLLYVANNFGLLVFDGENWSAIPIEQATRILSVAYSNSDRVYLGGQGDFGFFQASENGIFNYTSLKDKLPAKYQNFNEIWRIYPVGDVVYFFTFDYIFKLEKDQLEVIDPDVTLGFGFNMRGQLLTHVPSKGLMRLEGNALKEMNGGDRMMGKDVRGLVPFNMDRSLVATRNNGIFLMDDEEITPWEVPFNNWLKKAQINTIRLLTSNLYAIGTQNSGILVIDQSGNIVQLLSEDRGLTNNTVLSLFEDRFGNLWAGLNNGIALIEFGEAFTLINDNLELSGTGYTAFKTDSNVYLGTNNGLYTIENKLSSSLYYPRYKKIEGTEGQTYSLQLIGEELFLGHHQGAFTVEEQKAIDLNNSAQGVWKLEKLPTTKQRLIAGTYTGMHLLEKLEDKWSFQSKYEGFEESSRKFELTADSAIVWMSHGYKGIYKLSFSEDFESLDSVRFYGEQDGFPSNLLINVFRIQNRLVFPAEKGIYRYDTFSDRFVEDSVLTPYFGEQHIRELEEDIIGNLYFLTDDELGILKKNSVGDYEKVSAPFQKILPYVSDDLENIIVIDQENVLINAKEGFIHYDPSMSLLNTQKFSTVFRKIVWGDSTLFGGYNPRILKSNAQATNANFPSLPFSKKAIHFYFANAFFEGSYKPQYQYWLENFNDDWSDWSSETEKEYTNLPAGKYTFHVRGRNSAGDLSEISSYNFEILPPWYLSKAALTIYTVLGIASIAFAMVLVDKRYKRQQKSLVESANRTIQEQDSKLKEITTRSEAEITQLKNEKLKAELKHKNQELASSTMHLINKNEFMNHLKIEIGQLLKEENKQLVAKGLKRLVKTIEKNIAEDETWHQFEIHFDQVHGDFIKKLRGNYPALTPQEVKLSAFLRMNMSSKEIAQLLNISVRGVEISRYRLRKKLPIESHENLVEFMMGIG